MPVYVMNNAHVAMTTVDILHNLFKIFDLAFQSLIVITFA